MGWERDRWYISLHSPSNITSRIERKGERGEKRKRGEKGEERGERRRKERGKKREKRGGEETGKRREGLILRN